MDHEELKQLLSAHALSALDDADRSIVEEHLAGCAACASELVQWCSTAAALALAGDGAKPSPSVREGIMARIRAEQTRTFASASSTKAIPFASNPRTNLWASIGSLGTIAAGIGVVALLVSTGVLWQKNKRARAELSRLNSEIQSSEQRRQRDRELISFLSKPGTRVTELAGTNVAQGAHATLAYDTSGTAMLVARGLPVAPAGKAYQLWFIVGNKKLPGRVFTTDSAGNGDSKDQIPAAALGASIFAVTLEPATGMSSPTGEILLLSGS